MAATIVLYRAQTPPKPENIKSWSYSTPEYQNTLAATGRWFTDSFDAVLWYAEREEWAGMLLQIHLPRDVAEMYRVSNIPLKPGGQNTPDNPRAFSARPQEEFFLPAELACTAAEISIEQAKAEWLASRIQLLEADRISADRVR